MRGNNQLGKRQTRWEEVEEGKDETDRQEKPKKAYVVLPYMKGVTVTKSLPEM